MIIICYSQDIVISEYLKLHLPIDIVTYILLYGCQIYPKINNYTISMHANGYLNVDIVNNILPKPKLYKNIFGNIIKNIFQQQNYASYLKLQKSYL